jgi:four helix bundle protein
MNDQFNSGEIMINNQGSKKRYDLEARTGAFGEAIVKLAKKLPENSVTRSLISQLVRAGTSVGANYCEANDALTRKDFAHKIGLCRKESRETKHWLRMTAVSCPVFKEEANILWQEAQEINLIFSSIIIKLRENDRNK